MSDMNRKEVQRNSGEPLLLYLYIIKIFKALLASILNEHGNNKEFIH